MNSFKEIGGYFELELDNCFNNILNNAITLNTARNALRYIIQAYKIKELYVPYYTCPVVWEVIEKENCKINFYHINKNFMPEITFQKDSYILYTNYFGICAKNIKELAKKYKHLIIDNAQAFYMPKYGVASFNSVRKFFGVPDGALLFTDKTLNKNFEKDTSYDKCSHLLKRLDINAQFGYQDFKKNEDSCINEPIKYMSNLTKHILNSIDVSLAKEKRLENFKYLNSFFSDFNIIKINLDIDDVPMFYPFIIKDTNLRKKLIQNKIYVATYWNSLPEDYQEDFFQKYLIPIPIDQRYDLNDMKRIVEVVNE